MQISDEPTALLRFGTVGAPDLPGRVELLRAAHRLGAMTGAEFLLDVEADFSVREGRDVIFAEPSFPVAELARALELWAPAKDEPQDDFAFESMAYEVLGAVRIVNTVDGWTIGSHYGPTTTEPRPWPVVHAEIWAFVKAVKAATPVAVHAATGSMITAILGMHRAFDMSLADAKAFVIDAVGGVDPVNQRLHDVAENYGRTGVLGMRVHRLGRRRGRGVKRGGGWPGRKAARRVGRAATSGRRRCRHRGGHRPGVSVGRRRARGDLGAQRRWRPPFVAAGSGRTTGSGRRSRRPVRSCRHGGRDDRRPAGGHDRKARRDPGRPGSVLAHRKLTPGMSLPDVAIGHLR
ncbi:hypothetical protein [Promicromonospora sp. NPDC057488]|uniref:DUF7878 domain-containing protein n=1 Tax=Promicromonospora sp. NPDC057488 TaxID=3346147 RepID=UPI00367318C1